MLTQFVNDNSWVSFLAQQESQRSNTSVCLTLDLDAPQVKTLIKLLADENVALDIGAYRDAPSGLRIWSGTTVDVGDLEALMPWIAWAYHQVK